MLSQTVRQIYRKIISQSLIALIVGVFCVISVQSPANAQTVRDSVTGQDLKNRWLPPGSIDRVKKQNKKSKAPARVRIGLKLIPFAKVPTRDRSGKQTVQYVPDQALRHTLRARLNKLNHFFIGDYHIETKPIRFVRKTRRYEVRLNVYRRYGAYGQLEENLGHVTLLGNLEPQDDNIYLLYGAVSRRFRDKFGNPLLDIVAGYRPGEAGRHASRPKNMRRRVPPGQVPGTSGKPMIRGRF